MTRYRVSAAVAICAAAAATLAVLGEAGAEPSTTTSPATSTAPTSGAASSAYPSDQRGYLDSSARCDTDQVLMAYGRTSRSLVAICVDGDGDLEYRGVRLSDSASVTLAAGRAADGSIVATNDGVTYAVSSAAFLVSEGDSVLYRDPWVEFREPRFDDGAVASTTTSTTTTSAATASTPTVSTTTVTPTRTATPGG
jgi:hypothetical protein